MSNPEDKMKLELRDGTTDLLVFEEVIKEDCYRLRFWHTDNLTHRGEDEDYMELIDPKVIVDVGCHIGCFSVAACNLFPNCRVLSFEMIEENFLIAQRNLKNFKNNECVNVTIGGKNPAVGRCLNKNNAGGHKAVFKGADSYIGEKRIKWDYQLSNEDVKMLNFKQIFEDYNLEEIDLLKLDCEGAEHEIIPHLLETGLINKVRSIALEMHGREEKECSHIFSELEKIYKSVERTGAQGHLAFCQGLK